MLASIPFLTEWVLFLVLLIYVKKEESNDHFDNIKATEQRKENENEQLDTIIQYIHPHHNEWL